MPAVKSFEFSFRTGLGDFPLITSLGNMKAITQADLINLLQAANIAQRPGYGVISGTVIANDGFFQPGVFVSARNAEGRPVGDLFYNGLGSVPDFSNIQGTSTNGGFTAFNIPPGEVYLTATQGGRGGRMIEVFPDSVSQLSLVVVPLPIEKIPVTGFVLNPENQIPVINADIALYGSSEILTRSITRGAYRIEELAPARGYLVRVFASNFFNTYQEFETGTSELNVTISQPFSAPRAVAFGSADTSNLTGPNDLTRDFITVRREFLEDLADSVNVVLDPSKGIIMGRLRQSDGTGLPFTRINATAPDGTRIGQVFYFTVTGALSSVDPYSNPNIGGTSSFVIFNLPVGPVILNAKSFVVTSNQANSDKLSGGAVVLSVADSVFSRDIRADFLNDPLQPNLEFPHTVPFSGRVFRTDDITLVSGGKVDVLGVPPEFKTYTPFNQVCGQSSLPAFTLPVVTGASGNFFIPPNNDCDNSFPIPGASFQMVKVSGPNATDVETYQAVNMGTSLTQRDLTLMSLGDLGMSSPAEVDPDLGMIAGKVLNRQTGRTLEGVTLSVNNHRGEAVGRIFYTGEDGLLDQSGFQTQTSSDGGFVILDLPTPQSSASPPPFPGLVRIFVTSKDDEATLQALTFPGGVTLTFVNVTKIPTEKVVVSGMTKDLTQSNVKDQVSFKVQGTGEVFNSGGVSGAGAFTASLGSFGDFVLKSLQNSLADITTYIFHLNTGLSELTDQILPVATRSELALWANEGNLAEGIDPTKGILSGSLVTFSLQKQDPPYSLNIQNPSGIVRGFFDDDAFQDVAVINRDLNSVTVLFGTGDGTFGDGLTTFPAPRILTDSQMSNPSSIASGDFNGDGISDLVVANQGSNFVAVFFGTRSGNFISNRGFLIDGPQNFVVAKDFNRDGFDDIALSMDTANQIQILLSFEDGIFRRLPDESFIAIGGPPKQLAVGDLNGDGGQDIAVLVGGQGFQVLLGKANGIFQVEPIIADTGTTWEAMAIANIDRDQRTDANDLLLTRPVDDLILVGSGQAAVLFLRPGRERGVFFQLSGGSKQTAVFPRDIDGDGELDLAILNSDTQSLSIYLGLGNGFFQEARLSDSDLKTGVNPTGLTVGLFNQDELSDLVMINGDGITDDEVVTFLGNKQPFPDAGIDVKNELGRTVGTVRFWEDDGSGGRRINPALDRSAPNGRFIVFNVPPGRVSVNAKNTAVGNRLVTVYPDSVTETDILVKEVAPDFVNVEGQVGDVTGRPRPGVLLSFLGTGVNNVSPNFTGSYSTPLPANTETVVKITPKGSAGGVTDIDGDGVPDREDNCPNLPNPDQSDENGDGDGDVCDQFDQSSIDFDADGIADFVDNCPSVFNPNQLDSDGDGIGNDCEAPGG
ncbi:MAG TPA: FG-GAP-like repeat-containing protein [Nitrospiria bacterium]